MLALSIRQPYAELILRGIKTAEYRSRATRVVGRRFWIYVPKGTKARRHEGTEGEEGVLPTADRRLLTALRIWSDDLAVPGTVAGGRPVPGWMIDLAGRLIDGRLPTGVIVGSAVIERVEEMSDEVGTMNDEGGGGSGRIRHSAFRLPRFRYAWHLADVEPAKRLRRPARHPQPVWFRPF